MLRTLTRSLFGLGCFLGLLCRIACAAEPTIPVPRGYVSDYVGVVDAATARHLEALIEELRAKTGAEIAIVVVDSTGSLTAFDYAMKIAEAWKPGAKGRDNGVVFLVAIKDRQMFILTGYAVEGVLPDGRVGEIRDRLVRPAFRRGDYVGGIRAATEEMAGLIAREHGVRLARLGAAAAPATQPPPSGIVSVLLPLLLLLIFLLLAFRFPLLALFLAGRGGGGFSGGSGGGFSGGSGGFGGFGGGSFGGGGAGGDW